MAHESTILTPEEIANLRDRSVTQTARAAGVAPATVYQAIRSNPIRETSAEAIRGALNGGSNGHSTAPKSQRFGAGRPGTAELTSAEKARLKALAEAETQGNFCARIGVSPKSFHRAVYGAGGLREATAAKLRAALAPTDAPRKARRGGTGGRPGDTVLTPEERRAVRGLLQHETQDQLMARIGMSDNAFRNALYGKKVRLVTAQRIRALLGRDATTDDPITPASRRRRARKPGTDEAPSLRLQQAAERYQSEVVAPVATGLSESRLRELQKFLEGQILMAEFLNMSIIGFINGADPKPE